jgi:hypothetical protein
MNWSRMKDRLRVQLGLWQLLKSWDPNRIPASGEDPYIHEFVIAIILSIPLPVQPYLASSMLWHSHCLFSSCFSTAWVSPEGGSNPPVQYSHTVLPLSILIDPEGLIWSWQCVPSPISIHPRWQWWEWHSTWRDGEWGGSLSGNPMFAQPCVTHVTMCIAFISFILLMSS